MERLKRIPTWILDHAMITTGLIVLVTIVFALQLPRLEIDASAEGLMVEKDPARVYYEEVKKKFGSDNLTMIVVKSPNGVFTPEILGLVKRLSVELKKTAGVTRVESLTTVNNIKGEDDSLNTDALVPAEIPKSTADLLKIKADALRSRIYVGNVVSTDGKVASINVYTEAKPGDKEFNPTLVRRVDALIAKEKGAVPGVDMYQIGAPLIKVTLGEFIQGDQRLLVPLAVIFLLFILLISFGTLQGCLIPMTTGLISVVWGLGAMVLIGYSLNVITVIIPALLMAIGFTEDSHMISEYHSELEEGLDRHTAVRKMATESAFPIVVTTFTTVVGFGSLVTSDITMLIQFGVASALGLFMNWIISAAMVPVMLQWWPVPKKLQHKHHAEDDEEIPENAMTRFLRWLGPFDVRYKWYIASVTAVVSIICLWGWYQMKVNTDFVAFFKEDTFIRKRVKDIHESIAGVINFYVVVETGKEDGAKDPQVLRKVAELQDFLKSTGKIDSTLSVTDYLRTLHKEMNGGDQKFNAIPDTREMVAQYLLTLEGSDLTKYVDYNYSSVNVVVRHNITASYDLQALIDQTDAWVKKNFPKDLKVTYTGEDILINNAADYMAWNEITSFSTTFAMVALVHAALFMSFKVGFASLLPNIVPIVLTLGIMGFAGIPLNVGTCLVATIALGIAVDDTVHFMVRYSRELNRVHDQEAAMRLSVTAMGRPVIYSSIALAGGFVILVFSNFVPTIYLGWLSALVMIAAMLTELTITPTLLVTMRLVTVWDTLLAKMNKDIVATTPIFRNFWLWEAKKVAVMGHLQEFKKGDYIVKRGDIGKEMFLVINGKADVRVLGFDGAPKTIKVLEPGEVFGEMAIVEHTVRNADVVATEDVELLGIDEPALERLRKRFPYTAAKLFLNLAKIISGRLRETTESLRLQHQ